MKKVNRNIDFEKSGGLVPVIIVDTLSKDVLMLGYMNEEALQKTRGTGFVYFYSRTKKRLWMKGETSGNKLKVKQIFIDCDNDALLIEAKLLGTHVCHTGEKTCFSVKL